MNRPHVIVVGSGSAALCAGISAVEAGAAVTMLEKAGEDEWGGNSRYTAGAMRFAYNARDEILQLLADPADPRLAQADFGRYPPEQFVADIAGFNAGQPLNELQQTVVGESYATMAWLAAHNIRFAPIYSRQSYERNGRYVFWGGLTLEARGEGAGLVEAELAEFRRLGGAIRFAADCRDLVLEQGAVAGVTFTSAAGEESLDADAVVLACGGFEANAEMRGTLLGRRWVRARVRGTRHNTGAGIDMARNAGARLAGRLDGCHAVPMDRDTPEYGNPKLPFTDRKHYRKICYHLGIMVNRAGKRFVDEGLNFRNYTYAQYGRAILDQPGAVAWQIFDDKTASLLYDEYRFDHASFVEAQSPDALVEQMDDVDRSAVVHTIAEFNAAVSGDRPFDPTVLDGRGTQGLSPNKTNWANKLDTPPYRAYPVTCGITFTYAGLKIDTCAAVLDERDRRIPGLYACGEIAGEIFFDGYPGGTGLTSGAVFGRIAGRSAATAGQDRKC